MKKQITSTFTNIYDRNELIWGKDNQKRLFEKHVAVIGLGGVGSCTVEALARSGIGTLTLIDFDIIAETNINRQLPALTSTIGKSKAEVMEERINLINPHIRVKTIKKFCTEEITEKITDEKPDFIADAIDTMKSKINLIETGLQKGIPLISCLGAGNRLNPEELYITDISEIDTKNCIFSRNIVHQLKKRGIQKGLPVVASREKPVKTEKKSSLVKIEQAEEEIEFIKFTPGSSPFVPPVAGYLMAGFIVRQLISETAPNLNQ